MLKLVFIVFSSFVYKKTSKFESFKKVCENKDFFSVEMPSEDIKMLEF